MYFNEIYQTSNFRQKKYTKNTVLFFLRMYSIINQGQLYYTSLKMKQGDSGSDTSQVMEGTM